MSNTTTIEAMFPLVDWTGGSHIHRSLYTYTNVPWGGPDQRVATTVKEILDHGTGDTIWEYYQEHFGEMEWLLEKKQFIDLLTVDIYRLLNGQSTMTSSDRLHNPVTGNFFHRIALKDDVVGGIRFWYGDTFDGILAVYARFRLQILEDEGEEITVRERARTKALEVQGEVEPILQEIMEISEPPKVTEGGEQVTMMENHQ